MSEPMTNTERQVMLALAGTGAVEIAGRIGESRSTVSMVLAGDRGTVRVREKIADFVTERLRGRMFESNGGAAAKTKGAKKRR